MAVVRPTVRPVDSRATVTGMPPRVSGWTLPLLVLGPMMRPSPMPAVAPSSSLSCSIQTSHSSQDFDNEAVKTLELQDVHFSYPARPEKKVLEGMNLFIDRGQKLAVVGESGSGKSTVMALLERFYDHTQGTMLLNGQDMRLFNVKFIRSKIGYVGQEPVLFASTIADTIRQGCQEASDADVGRSADAAQLDLIKALPQGLQTYVGTGGSQFSGSCRISS